MKTDKWEYKTYELTCVSPVHIGNGEKLRAFEYLYDRARQEVYFVDETRWIQFLSGHRLIDSFAEYLEQTAEAMQQKEQFKGKNVWEWLRDKDIPEDEIRSLAARTALAATNTSNPKEKGTLNDIVCQMALPDGRPYIPGSSVKGALRTAILHRVIRENEKLCTRYWGKLKKAEPEAMRDAEMKAEEEIRRRSARQTGLGMQDLESLAAKKFPSIFARKLGIISKDMENEAFARLDYSSAKNKFGKPLPVTDAAKSALRGLQVGDASPVGDSLDTVILQKIDATRRADLPDTKEATVSLFRECLPVGAKLRFSVTLDKSMMKTVGIHSLDELWETARRFTQDCMKAQKKVFGEEYKGEFAEAVNAGLLLGGGVGYHAKTIVASLAPSPEEARIFIADYLEREFKKQGHHHKELDREISPRTLKLTRDRNASHIMGLCEVVPC